MIVKRLNRPAAVSLYFTSNENVFKTSIREIRVNVNK